MQSSFSELEYAGKRKQTRRDRSLAEIEAVTPWSALEAEIELFYPKGGGLGRPPIGVGRMLRMYVAQQCFSLSDEGIEDAIYDSQVDQRLRRHQPGPRGCARCDHAVEVPSPAGDAPGKEGQPVVLRDEGAHRRRC